MPAQFTHFLGSSHQHAPTGAYDWRRAADLDGAAGPASWEAPPHAGRIRPKAGDRTTQRAVLQRVTTLDGVQFIPEDQHTVTTRRTDLLVHVLEERYGLPHLVTGNLVQGPRLPSELDASHRLQRRGFQRLR